MDGIGMGVRLLVTVLGTVLLLAILRYGRGRRRSFAALAVGAAASALVAPLIWSATRAAAGEHAEAIQAAAGAGVAIATGVAVGRLVGGGRLHAPRRLLPAVTASGVVVLLTVAALGAADGTAGADQSDPAAAARVHALPAPTPARSGVAVWRVADIDHGPGYRGIVRLSVPVIRAGQDVALSRWRSSGAPAAGRLGSVVIPGTTSRFPARPALLYLPPAALTRTPARLPVVVLFSGQSVGAGPFQLDQPGGLEAMVDRIAAAHGGVAPIVVVPDQLGPGSPNPMCVDSGLGDVATYITHDVRGWILRHLPVDTGRREWTVAGFSEGGTCAIQFGAGYPRLFGSFVDISGELTPTNGTLHHTIDVGFHGSAGAYHVATPLRLLAEHAPFHHTRAYFAVGALDRHYGPVEPLLRHRATADGITGGLRVFPGQAHTWRLGSAGLAWGLSSLADWWGLPRPGA